MKTAIAEKWMPCIPIVAAPSTWCCAVRVQGKFIVLFFDTGGGPFPNAALTRTWE